MLHAVVPCFCVRVDSLTPKFVPTHQLTPGQYVHVEKPRKSGHLMWGWDGNPHFWRRIIEEGAQTIDTDYSE